ncbi:hypothetical protein ANCDUO_17568 [Ancylostoma duodenale]|uniref:Uncharacterized protein n=1 Tax=Ancylostoma duodenale TaxID=51022 RepID=A0A0C2FUQ6_9BILA|nr:hypothetical protein ANCDUO_17568 [Ancylostoma duodenale]
MEDRVWVRDYRTGREKWIPAHVKKRYGRAVYDVLTEEDDLWRRHANQMRGEEQHRKSCENTDASDLPFHQERRYKDVEETITDAKDNAEVEEQSTCHRLQRPDHFDNADHRADC